MAGFSFRIEELRPIDEFYSLWNKPEREFINPELEAAKKALWQKVKKYQGTISYQTFPTHRPVFQTVPPDWETEQPERFHRVVNELHSLAGDIVALHADLIRKGRAYLVGVGEMPNSDR